LLLGASVVLAVPSARAERLVMPILRVIDGDTLVTRFPSLPKVLQEVHIRLAHVDTPESGDLARCWAERRLAAKATDFTRAAVKAARKIQVEPISWDKYGGRFDAVVYLDGVSLGDKLLKAKLAVPYDGGKRRSWCRKS
jgi:endonuclease YncB( thermonuclease family)